jgi:hypothetical protein
MMKWMDYRPDVGTRKPVEALVCLGLYLHPQRHITNDPKELLAIHSRQVGH